MTKNKCFILCIPFLLICATAGAERLVDELLADYDKVETVSCEVRRTTEIDGRKVRALSRVQYARPDRINVHSRAPIKRRHVADGERLYYYVEGDPKGFSRPIDQLDRDWLISLRQVPGSPMNHLLEIGKAQEDELPATTEFPVRRGYATDKPYIVLSLDADGRLAQVEYFETAALDKRVLICRYEDFSEPLPGVWIPKLHKSEFSMHGVSKDDSVQFVNMIFNETVAANIFNAELYFKGVEFVDDFEQIYK